MAPRTYIPPSGRPYAVRLIPQVGPFPSVTWKNFDAIDLYSLKWRGTYCKTSKKSLFGSYWVWWDFCAPTFNSFNMCIDNLPASLTKQNIVHFSFYWPLCSTTLIAVSAGFYSLYQRRLYARNPLRMTRSTGLLFSKVTATKQPNWRPGAFGIFSNTASFLGPLQSLTKNGQKYLKNTRNKYQHHWWVISYFCP